MGSSFYFILVAISGSELSVTKLSLQEGEIVITGDIDESAFQAFVDDRPLDLSRKEYDILLFFMYRPNRLIHKEALAENVWGDHIDQTDNFDFIYAQIKNVRKKLSESGASAEIKSVYGFGYKFVET